ncbi:MAG: endolytic transglycosylase MltG [Candidatus Marisimplicoccus sp.]|tara:strand:- start:854 stop:1882 length:1029 start_codon:yes stop_codon:yes gene_type:complete
MKFLKVIIPVTIILSILFIDYYNKYYKDNTSFKDESIFLYIVSNDSVSFTDSISKYIKSEKTFYRVAEKLGYLDNIKTGRFKINKGIGNKELVTSLKFNNTPLTITFNNQERVENLAGRISKQIYADSTALINSFTDKDFLVENKFNKENILSIFIPNSYEVYWDIEPDQFRDKMLLEYEKFWNKSRTEKAKNIGLTKKEVTSLASIVQKESIKVDERPTIAGVYINRLNTRMRLQADPTVIYSIKDYYKNFDTIIRRVLYRDLRLNSRYNTYRINGLPPGPISMPDISAIDAVLNYEKHKYIFFVADPYNRGYHLFARNLSEHNRNKKVYTRWLNSRGIYR